jgi:hypothetical protein
MSLLKWLGIGSSTPSSSRPDPVAAARYDVGRLRLYAINITTNATLQQHVYGICENLTVCLSEVERKPGHMTILGDLLTITDRMRESLETWARVTRLGTGTEKEATEKRNVEQMFADLSVKYADLRQQVVNDNANDLRVNVSAITGLLSAVLPKPK